jgi:polyvinyl alcohol dehydrogenase (cytochrome)
MLNDCRKYRARRFPRRLTLARRRPAAIFPRRGAISVTPELVLAGSDDAHIRIYDAANGKVLWDRDTNRDFSTVNGVPGHGGAMSGSAAPLANDGELIVASGYGFISKMPGNVLLVFGVE